MANHAKSRRHGTRSFVADAVPPVVAGDKIPARIADAGERKRADKFLYILPESRPYQMLGGRARRYLCIPRDPYVHIKEL